MNLNDDERGVKISCPKMSFLLAVHVRTVFPEDGTPTNNKSNRILFCFKSIGGLETSEEKKYILIFKGRNFVQSLRSAIKSKWKFKMAFAIRRPTPPPLMAKFPDIFSPHFFSFATDSYIYETDFTLQKYYF